jgi:predicted transcriptional regulator of viral defense system
MITQLDRLRDIALDHYGFVTTKQAAAIGIPAVELVKMHSRGRLERVAHGVYRVPHMPQTRFDQFQLAVLWTGDERTVLGHETALELWELGDYLPDKIHLTIPPTLRLRRAGGDGYVLHAENLSPTEVTWCEGLPIVTPAKAIEQCIREGFSSATSTDALTNALEREHVSESDHERLMLALESRDRLPQ